MASTNFSLHLRMLPGTPLLHAFYLLMTCTLFPPYSF